MSAGEGVGGNPAVLAELAETKRGVAAVDRRAKGPIQGVTASHALNYDGLDLPF
ncbi:MAG: hypothetical protein KBG80_08040 [Breznakibacter sp.]|nr:hypothetical protein [Breznakibacter sp.]